MALDTVGERPARSWSASRTGLIATVVAAVLVLMLLVVISVAANRDGLGPPPTIPSLFPLGLLYGAPAAIGWLGARSARRPLLTSAGLLYLPLAVLAFSGVTLPFLLPALLYLRAAATREPVASSAELPRPPGRSSRRSLIALAAVLASVPIVLWIVASLGIFGVVGVVAVAGLAPALTRRVQPTAADRSSGRPGRTMRAQLRGALGAAAIVALVLAHWGGRDRHDKTCWIRARTSSCPAVPATTRSPCRAAAARGCDGGTCTPRHGARVLPPRGHDGTALLVTV